MERKKKKTKLQFTPQLPEDVIIDILLRLPAKPLVRFRCVSKPWHSLLTSHHFTTTHLDRASFIEDYNKRHNVILSSSTSFRFLYGEKPNPHAVRLEFPLKNLGGFQVFGSCDGLLCIVFDMNTAVLWNPSTREYKRLPVPCSSGRKSSLFGYGFGYDSSIDDYKVVRICPSARQGVPMGAELYTLKTNSWKKIEGITFDVLFMDRLDRGSFANGALYWWVIAFTFSKDEYDSSSKILRFDLRDEKFKLLPPPRDIPKNLLMNLGVIAGFLCTGRDNHGSGIKLWRLKDDGVKQMWSKGVTIGVNRCLLPICYPICYPKMGEVLMHIIRKGQDNIVLCLCNLDDTTLKTQLIHVPEFWSDATTYVESLVSPNRCWEEKRNSKRWCQCATR